MPLCVAHNVSFTISTSVNIMDYSRRSVIRTYRVAYTEDGGHIVCPYAQSIRYASLTHDSVAMIASRILDRVDNKVNNRTRVTVHSSSQRQRS